MAQSLLFIAYSRAVKCVCSDNFFHLQIWNLGSPDPNFTLDAHQKGVNCVDYFTGGDKPYLITGSDDHTAKVFFWLSFLYMFFVLSAQYVFADNLLVVLL